MDKLRQGSRPADWRVKVSNEFRNDMSRWWKALEQRTAKTIQYGPEGNFVWHPRLAGLKELALSMPSGAAE